MHALYTESRSEERRTMARQKEYNEATSVRLQMHSLQSRLTDLCEPLQLETDVIPPSAAET